MKESFDREQAASRKNGLSVADFVRVMMKLLGALVVNKEELCIQILELFAAIDVNGDRILEWEELLNYIVEQQSAGGDENVTADYFAAKFAYRPLQGARGDGQDEAPKTSSGVSGSDAGAHFDAFTSAQWFTDRETGTVCVLGFRKYGLLAHCLRMGVDGATPVMMPLRRFRHDLNFVPHQLLSAVFVPETYEVVTCSRECEGGPVRLAFFDFTNGLLKDTVHLAYPCSLMAYTPSVARLYCVGDEGGLMYAVDVHSREVVQSLPHGNAQITAMAMLPGHLSAGMITGHGDGQLQAWDLRAGKPIPGFDALAHDYGVRCLAFSEAHGLLISAGCPHPRHLQGLPPAVNAVQVWDISEWVEDLRAGDAYSRAVVRRREAEANRSATNNLALLRRTYEAAHAREAQYSGGLADGEETEEVGVLAKAGDAGEGEADGDAPAHARTSRAKAFGDKLRANGIKLTLTAPDPDKYDLARARTEKDEDDEETPSSDIPPPKRKKGGLRPRVLMGHKHPVTTLALQEEAGCQPHIVSVDESGVVRVWNLVAGGGSAVDGESQSPVSLPPCLQALPLYPVPPPPRSQRGAVEMGKAGLGIGGKEADAEASTILASPSSMLASSSSPEGKATRRMSYSRASVMLYPDKGEGEAEKAVRALVEQGLLDNALNGKSAVVDAILRTGSKYGVGERAVNMQSTVNLPGMARQGGSPRSVSDLSGSHAMLSVDDVRTVTSSILSMAASMMPEVSARRMRIMGGAPPPEKRKGGVGGGMLPALSSSQQLLDSAKSAANAFNAVAKREAERALAGAGVNVEVLSPEQKRALTQPLLNKGSPQQGAKMGRRASVVGGKDGGNLLSAMLDLRLAGRRGSISDFALMLAGEAKDQAGSDAAERRRQISDEQGGIKFASGGPAAAADDDSLEDADMFMTAMKSGKHPNFIMLLPKKVGGHEKRNMMVIGGERVGLGGGASQKGGAAGASTGGVSDRYGMRMFTWMQDVPDREPLLASFWLSPIMQFLTATASALVMWDALTGRPIRVYDRRAICEGREITCVTLDKRQRKAIVGDSAGFTTVINLTSGAVMKQLDPRATRPKLAPRRVHDRAGASMLMSRTLEDGGKAADSLVPQHTMPKLPKYVTPMLGLAYTPRLELLSFSGDGSLWLSDEGSLGGWALGTMSSTLMRIYPMPVETFRGSRLLTNVAMTDSQAVLTSRSEGALPGLSVHMNGSMMSLPEGLEGGASVLTQAHAGAGDGEDGRPASPKHVKPAADAIIRVTGIAVSVRLNLVAVCVRVLKDLPHSESATVGTDTAQAGTDPLGAGAAASSATANAGGLLDEDSYTVLMYEYEKCVLLGACTRAPTDRKGGMAAAMTRGNSLIFGTMRTDGKVTQDHFSAASTLATALATANAGGGSAGHAGPYVAMLGEEGEADAAAANNGSPGKLDVSIMSDLLLPSITAMSFLDPLAALLTAHDDGGMRMWATPPTACACTLRILWFLPLNPSNALYSSRGKKLSAAMAKRRMSLAAVRVVKSLSHAVSKPEGEEEGHAHIGHTHAHGNGMGQGNRRASVGGLDPEEAAAISQRRFPVSLVVRPALSTAPMRYGTLFPTGHGAYCPGGEGRLETGAGAPPMNLFVEPIKRRGSASGPSAPAPAKDGVGGGANVTASTDGFVCWAGDTDGEVHRWFISSAALAGAGLEHVKPVANEDVSLTERRLDETPLQLSALALALLWSRTQNRMWAQRQMRHVACVSGMGPKVSTARNHIHHIPSAVHPMLRSFYAQTGRQPVFPLVGEVLPPGAYIVPEPITAAAQLLLTEDGPMPDLPASVCPHPTSTVTWHGSSISGPVGVVWEGAWRAHSVGDVSSLQCITDSGVTALLTAGQDGLARIWDTCGRLLGTLDPQPRFTAPMPDWAGPQATAELLAATLDKDKSQGLERVPGVQEEEEDAPARRHADKGKPSSILAPLLAAVPTLYGPGRGSGYSFDCFSMTHLCTERVYDGRVVWVPLGVKVPAPGKPVSASEGGEAEAVLAASELGFLTSGAPLSSGMLATLPTQWHPGQPASKRLVLNDLGELVPAPPTRAPSLYGTHCLLGFRLPESVAVPSLAVLEAGEVAARNRAVAARRRSSLSMGLLGGTGKDTMAQSVAAAVAAAVPSSPSAFASQVSHGPREPEGFSSSSSTLIIPHTDLGVCMGVPAARKSGVYFAAMAPPQTQALWHLAWDLLARRSSQLDGAGQAMSLVALVKLKETSGWGRRSNMIQSAARRLSTSMLEMAAAGSMLPKPPGRKDASGSPREVEEVTEAAARLQEQGADLMTEEAQRQLIKTAVTSADQKALQAGSLASVASRVAATVVTGVITVQDQTQAKQSAAAPSAASSSGDHATAHAVKVRHDGSFFKGALVKAEAVSSPHSAARKGGVRFEGSQEAKASDLQAAPVSAYVAMLRKDPVAATLYDLGEEVSKEKAAAEKRKAAPSNNLLKKDTGGISPIVRKAALAASLRESPSKSRKDKAGGEHPVEVRPADEALLSLIESMRANMAAR